MPLGCLSSGFSCTALIDISLTLEASDIPVADSLRYSEFLYWMIDHSCVIGCRHAASISCVKEKQRVLRTMCERIFFLCTRAFILQLTTCTIHKNAKLRLAKAQTDALVGLIRHLHSVVNKGSTHTFTKNMSVICEECLRALEPLWTEYQQRKDTYKPFFVEEEATKPSEEIQKQVTGHTNAVPGKPVDEKSASYRLAYGMMLGIEASVRVEDGMRVYNKVLHGMRAFRDELQILLKDKNTELPACNPSCSEHSELSLDLIDLALSTITLFYTLPEEGSLFSPKHILGSSEDIWFEDLAPALFAKVRRICNVESKEYLRSVTKRQFSFIQFQTNSKSGEMFFFSHDGRFLLKTISNREAATLLRMLPAYISHVELGASFLMRICGLYRFSTGTSRKVRHVLVAISVMDCKALGLHHQFDLKGSTVGRSAGPDHNVQKDCDWLDGDWMVDLPAEHKRRIAEIQQADAEFLAQQQVLDYSVLIGIHDRKSTEAGVQCRSVKLLASIISNKVMPMIRKARLLKAASSIGDTDSESGHGSTKAFPSTPHDLSLSGAAFPAAPPPTATAEETAAPGLGPSQSVLSTSSNRGSDDSSYHIKPHNSVAAANGMSKLQSLFGPAGGAGAEVSTPRSRQASIASVGSAAGIGADEGSFGSSRGGKWRVGPAGRGRAVDLDEELLRIKALKAAGTKRQEAMDAAKGGAAGGGEERRSSAYGSIDERRNSKTEQVVAARPGISSCPWDGPHGPICATGECGSRGRYVYLVGIIDFLTPWQPRKRVEYGFNWLLGKGRTGSCAPPRMYADRQTNFFVSRVLGMYHMSASAFVPGRPQRPFADISMSTKGRLSDAMNFDHAISSTSNGSNGVPCAANARPVANKAQRSQSIPNAVARSAAVNSATAAEKQGKAADSEGLAGETRESVRSPSAPGLLQGEQPAQELSQQAKAQDEHQLSREIARLASPLIVGEQIERIPAIPKEGSKAEAGEFRSSASGDIGPWGLLKADEVHEQVTVAHHVVSAGQAEAEAEASAAPTEPEPPAQAPGNVYTWETQASSATRASANVYKWGREVSVTPATADPGGGSQAGEVSELNHDTDDADKKKSGDDSETLVLSQMSGGRRPSRAMQHQISGVTLVPSSTGSSGAAQQGPAHVHGPSAAADTPRTSSPVAGASPKPQPSSSYVALGPPALDRLSLALQPPFDGPGGRSTSSSSQQGATRATSFV